MLITFRQFDFEGFNYIQAEAKLYTMVSKREIIARHSWLLLRQKSSIFLMNEIRVNVPIRRAALFCRRLKCLRTLQQYSNDSFISFLV